MPHDRSPISEQAADQIKQEIWDHFGFFPSFFLPASNYPELLQFIWQATKSRYLQNPLQKDLKELLILYVSQHCGNSYCLIVHSCGLVNIGYSGKTIYHVLTDLKKSEISPNYKFILENSLNMYMHPEKNHLCIDNIKKALGDKFIYWTELMMYISMSHIWVESFQAEIHFATDQQSKNNLQKLIGEEKRLKSILKIP